MVVVVVALVATLASARPAHAADEQRARAHFVVGVEAYEKADYARALAEFRAAHEQSGKTDLYFNMAACEERLGRYDAAASYLRTYLVERPGASDREVVEARIRILEEADARIRALAARPANAPSPVAVATAVTPRPTPVPPAGASSSRALPGAALVIGGMTLATGIAAIAVGAWNASEHGTLAEGCGRTAAGCSDSQIAGLRNTAYATDALVAVAVVGVVATVLLAVIEARHHTEVR